MTRDQITTLVTKTVNQLDATSVSLCNDYVQRAYETVWNAELWRDTVTIDTSIAVTAGTNTYTMPAAFDRVVSLQLLSSGVPIGFLDPTTTSFIIQTEPTALTVQGVPTKYEEFVHTDGTKKIRLFPLPNASYTLTMSAKRVCPTLIGSDTLQIRNIDNAVIALAIADMYTRQRHLGKAGEMAKKAGAFIEEARKIELEQSNQPRVAKQLTVAGNSLAEMADAVCERTDQWSPKAVISIKEFLRRNYQDVYDRHLWAESTVVVDVISVTGTLILPYSVDRVIAIRGNASLGQLSAVQPSLYYGIAPQIFEQTGDPLSFSYLAPSPVLVLPTVGERLSIVSSSALDKTAVFVRGTTSGNANEARESVNLDGTTPVLTANTILGPLTIAKGLTTGMITVTGSTSGTKFVELDANQRERKHIRIWLQPTPTSNIACKVLCKRKITPLVQDEDTPSLRAIGNVLINLATADMFSKLGNKDGSTEARMKGEAAVKTLIDLEMNQGAMTRRVVPSVESYGWNESSYGFLAKV